MTDQTNRLLKAKIALALANELKRRPSDEEVEKYAKVARILFTSIVGTKMAEKRMRDRGQLAIF